MSTVGGLGNGPMPLDLPRRHVCEWASLPNGEAHAAVQERARKVLEDVRKILPGGDVVLVGHGHFSRLLIAAWLGLAPDQGVHFGLDPAVICQLGDERGDTQVRRLNVPAWEV